MEDLENAPTFKEAFKNFTEFVSSDDPIFCVWGKSDLRELYRNIKYHNLPDLSLPKSYIDVQYYASDFINHTTAQSIGLENAVIALNLEDTVAYHNALNDAYYTAKDVQYYASDFINHTTAQSIGLENAVIALNLEDTVAYHNALNDAYYTAKVFASINPKAIKPNIYIYTNLSDISSFGLDPLDEDIFLKECDDFSKVLNRNLSKDEKKILSMVQFIKNNISK